MTPVALQSVGTAGDSAGLVFAFAAVTAVAGAFVAFLAYRGYRRNDSRPMLYLAVGIALLTTVPVGLNHALSALTGATDAAILLAITVAHLAGVASILYALTRA
ncbi:DUF7521 family protein [Halorussus sp. GCM10023401]|uniref:DUF7521 family protein n=1 Tax=Halorussus TaxID=1070314 RepID=UPI0020A22A8C|nr:hypothetical protein [Halorussus vallis]USZ74232.1 hypothetical protein NGM07_12335 [Halorussus vallis]